MAQNNVTHSYINVKNLKNREPMYIYYMWYFVKYVIINIIQNYNWMDNSNKICIITLWKGEGNEKNSNLWI